jgi:CheY-like chemotaxis protein
MTSYDVVVVEDDHGTATLLKRGIERMGLSCCVFAVASEALQFIAQSPPSIVVMDILLPEPHLDGIEAIKQIRAHPQLQGVAIIVTTASDLHIIKKACAVGANTHLSKPFSFADLEAVVQSLGDYLS